MGLKQLTGPLASEESPIRHGLWTKLREGSSGWVWAVRAPGQVSRKEPMSSRAPHMPPGTPTPDGGFPRAGGGVGE